MAHLATLLLILPLVGFIAILINGTSWNEKVIGYVATGAVSLSFVASVIVFFQLISSNSREVTVNLFSWISVGSLKVPAALLVDPLSITRSECDCFLPAHLKQLARSDCQSL